MSLLTLASGLLIALSLFNMLNLLWLGITIFLTADERRLGLWLVLVGMLLGALFFLSHTVILVTQLTATRLGTIEHWWRIGWLPVIFAPLVWYVEMLWYAGLWDAGTTHLRWHLVTVRLLFVVAILLAILHLFFDALPDFNQLVAQDFSRTLSIAGIPVMLLLFPPYVIMCILLPLHALKHPAPSRRMMGELARERARPWLTNAALLLLIVSVGVAVFVAIVIATTNRTRIPLASELFNLPVVLFDLFITGMIAAAIFTLGQAVVAYEIFTGKVLPRRGLARQWHTTLVLIAGVSGFISYSLLAPLPTIYSLLSLTIVAISAYAALNWQSFVYRDTMLASLRPFFGGQRLMHDMLNPDDDAISYATELFHVLCQNMLGAKQAQITALGAFAALVGESLVYPVALTAAAISSHSVELIGTQAIVPYAANGFRWLLPLWAERGLIGVMLLGDKRDDSLYSQEEIEATRASGERIIDLLAAEQMVRRLMLIQRRRLTEQRVMDMQTRRALHDDVLPAIHTAILKLHTLSSDATAVEEPLQMLTDVHKQIASLIHSAINLPQQQGSAITDAVQQMIEHEFSGEFHRIDMQLPDSSPVVDAMTAGIVLAAVREMIRNAALHGRGGNPDHQLCLWLHMRVGSVLEIIVRDNGVGFDNRALYAGGSGGGLALHSTMMAIVGGDLTAAPADEGGVQVTLTVPHG